MVHDIPNYESFQETATPSLPDILTDEAKSITGDVLTYRHFLHERMLVEEAAAIRYRGFNRNAWSFADGDYRHPSEEEPAETRWRIDAPLSGIEELWSQQIDDVLAQKQGLGEPVILLDFGGGFGISLMRLGAQDEYRRAIERGDLILVATNLGYLPSDEPDNEGYTAIAKSINARNKQGDGLFRDAAQLEFIQNNQNTVQFLDANAIELEDATLQTVDGRTIPIKGHVDILSEQMSLAHTHTPDIVLGIFAELLSQKGTLYLNTKTRNFMEPPPFKEIEVAGGQTISVDGSQGREYYNQRRAALDVGVAAVTHQLGLEIVHDSMYSPLILSKP